ELAELLNLLQALRPFHLLSQHANSRRQGLKPELQSFMQACLSHVFSPSNLYWKLRLQKRPAMERDHQIFIRRNDPGGRLATLSCDPRPALGVGRLVDLEPEPGRLLAHPPADLRGVLADARREHERIEAAKRGCERAQFPADAVNEKIDGFLRVGICARKQGSHVVAEARDP